MAEEMEELTGTLTLTGEGQVRARPDVVTINLGVVTMAKTAQEAVNQNAELLSQVIARIKALGIPDEDIQTAGYFIIPMMDFREGSQTFGQTTSYRVENTLNVRTSQEKAPQVLDEAVAAGANVAGGLTFGLLDEAAARQQALEAAVMAARRDAGVLSRALGVTLLHVITAEVLYGGSPIILRAALREAASAATPVEPGMITLTANVRVVFQFRNPAETPQIPETPEGGGTGGAEGGAGEAEGGTGEAEGGTGGAEGGAGEAEGGTGETGSSSATGGMGESGAEGGEPATLARDDLASTSQQGATRGGTRSSRGRSSSSRSPGGSRG